MQNTQDLLFKLEQLLKWKKSKKFYAEKLNISESEVEDLLLELRGHEIATNDAEAANYIGELEQMIIEVNNEKGTRKSTIELDFEPKNDEELAKLHKIDLNKYKIKNYWSKLKANGKFTSSVFASLKKPDEYSLEDFSKFLENYKSDNQPIKVEIPHQYKMPVDVEISISDFHLMKKTVSEGGGVKERKELFMTILKNLVRKVKGAFSAIDTIVFPIGNDFFHTDTYQNTTTAGTPQDVMGDYASEYEEGFDLLVQAIKYLKQNCVELEVILIQGNHDRTKSFYVAHALSKYFENDKDIHFDRKHSTTKWAVLGETFIGYHHGNCKIEDLPLIFATSPETSELFGRCKYREVHTGDKHHYMTKEVKGVRIQQMPSLSGVDRWHIDNNYINNIRAAIANVYDFDKGKIAELEERI